MNNFCLNCGLCGKSPITKTRHAHQVTVAALSILLSKAYKSYCDCTPVSMDIEEKKNGTKLPSIPLLVVNHKFSSKSVNVCSII